MEYSDDMSTSIQDIKNRQSTENLGKKIEQQLDNFDYQPDIIPQTTLQKAPPMRQGRVENYPTHQMVNQNNYYPQINRNIIPSNQIKIQPVVKNTAFLEGIMSGIYQRIIDPIIITILFIIFAHRIVAKGSNPYLPFVNDSPSTDFVSLGFRGFILSVIYLIIKRML